MNWTNYFFQIAESVSLKSKDPSTKVGAIIVNPRTKQILSTGFNGFPRGVVDERRNSLGEESSRYSRPDKYIYTEHAERNAIYHAANHGIELLNSILILNVHSFPCVDCTRAIIQSGIIKILVGPKECPAPKDVNSWRDNLKHSDLMLRESGVMFAKYHQRDIDLDYEDPIFLSKGTKRIFNSL